MIELIHYSKLIRLPNCLLAAIGVFIGAHLAGPVVENYPVFMAGLATFLVCAAGNIVNDIRDVEIDRINRPDRVLPSNKISITQAFWVSTGCNLLAIAVSLLVSWPVAVVACIAIGLLYAYNISLKRIPVIGNLVIALLSGLVFMTGGLAVDWHMAVMLPGPILGGLFAFLFHLVREIVKDCQDMAGDQQQQIRTLPLMFGKQPAILIALGLFFLMTILTYWPILEGWYSDSYKIIAVYILELPLMALLIITYGFPTPKILTVASQTLKVGMLLGILALFLA